MGQRPSTEALAICPYPFARMELSDRREFVPCCSSWLKADYFSLPQGEDVWNGPAARALRESVLRGDYRYCRRDLCQARLVNPALEDYDTVSEAPIASANREAILRGAVEMPAGPAALNIANDPRCNLACPSCRKGHIFTVNASTEQNLAGTDLWLEKHRSSLEVLKIGGDGEVFFSPWLRSLVKRIDRETFPRFRHIYILSNGQLFDEEAYQALMPGAAFIKQVSISVDAGNEHTYRLVRGGSWPKLVKNLRWIGEQRRKKIFRYFQLNFTLRLDNFESLPEFIALAKEVGAGNAKVTAFFDYPKMAVADYRGQAIHLPEHPRHGELRKLWEAVSQDSFVRWSLPIPRA